MAAEEVREPDGSNAPLSNPGFRVGHRTKKKVTFSERQRQRRSGDLADSGRGLSHRFKSKVTFSERQRLRKRGELVERETLDLIDGVDGAFGSSWPDYVDSLATEEDSTNSVGSDSATISSNEVASAQQLAPADVCVSGARSPGLRLKLPLNKTGRRLLSGAIAGGFSRTGETWRMQLARMCGSCDVTPSQLQELFGSPSLFPFAVVAPLETIRTHLMVGSTGGHTVSSVFRHIMAKEGWRGLFRGNAINVLRIAPSKALELFTYETVKSACTPHPGNERPLVRLPRIFPPSSVAGAAAGVVSCSVMYPLELLKTRLTVQPDMYRGFVHALVRIISEEGPLELYRGLGPSLMGIIPYAGANYYAYDKLRSLYRKMTKKKEIGSVATLLIGSLAGAFAASVTFPLEVTRKQMQVGGMRGRVVYKGTLDCMRSIVREEGIAGLYRGLAPSCLKLMPAAGISFMCYEALKELLRDD